MKRNFNQTMYAFGNSMIALGKLNITVGKLFRWNEYLELLNQHHSKDWLKLLKVALQIYNGKCKGFADVPEEQDIREGILKVYMKTLIKQTVSTIL